MVIKVASKYRRPTPSGEMRSDHRRGKLGHGEAKTQQPERRTINDRVSDSPPKSDRGAGPAAATFGQKTHR